MHTRIPIYLCVSSLSVERLTWAFHAGKIIFLFSLCFISSCLGLRGCQTWGYVEGRESARRVQGRWDKG